MRALATTVAVHGQKTYNGVAILSKRRWRMCARACDGEDEDVHARYIEAVVEGPEPVRVASIYLPNGNPVGTDKFAYKLRWMERLNAHASALLALEEPLALAGDYNVIPEPEDCHNPASWMGDALFQPETRAGLPGAEVARPHRRPRRGRRARRTPTPSGTTRPAPGSGTTASASTTSCSRPRPPTASAGVTIQRDARGRDKPSDHVPVTIELNI